MCELCAHYDFPIADVWRPCYQPRPSAPVRRVPPPLNDEDVDRSERIRILEATIRRQRRELQELRALLVAQQGQAQTVRPAFEGVIEQVPAGGERAEEGDA